MRKQAVGVCLRALGAILWSPRQGVSSLQIGPQWEFGSHPLASEIQKCGAKLALSEVRKQQLGGFSSVCVAILFEGSQSRKCEFCQQGPVSWFTLRVCPRRMQEFSRLT